MEEKLQEAVIDEAIKYGCSKMKVECLRAQQDRCVRSFLDGNDVFTCLPTGYGKSLCFGILPHIFDYVRHVGSSQASIVICVAPLLSLMADQYNRFKDLLSVIAINSTVQQVSIPDVVDGKAQLIYISPEALLNNMRYREMLQSRVYRENLVAFVVDEAHTVKRWGDQFRTEFSRLGEVRSLVPQHVRVMALTATATRKTREVVMKRLSMIDPIIISVTPNKPNIKYSVVQKLPIETVVARIVRHLVVNGTNADRTIIYCRYCKEVVEFYEEFKKQLGVNFTSPPGFLDSPKYRLVDMYMSVTTNLVKEQIVKSYCDPLGNLRVLICTVAFGMGLDCPNVRNILHWGPSSDLEGYIQESGRGGRDGEICMSTIMYHASDKRHTARVMIDYCENQGKCRRHELFNDFDDYESLSMPNSACKCCDVCAKQCKCGDC